jgi:toxin CptA
MRRVLSPLRLHVAPSRAWFCWVTAAVASAALLLCSHVSPLACLPLPWLGWRALRADGWLGGAAPAAFAFDAGSGRAWLDDDVGQRAIRIREDSVVWPWLIVLRFELAGRCCSRCIFPDSAPADVRRRLRVFLRWAPSPHD